MAQKLYDFDRTSNYTDANILAAMSKKNSSVQLKQVVPLETLFEKRLPLWKRTMDLGGAFIGIIIVSPIMLATVIAIKATSKGPIVFKQKRAGINNVLFIMYKFRSMKKDTPDIATHLLENPTKYLLNIGGLLRKFSLDEFPNLINILKGDMGFVGPRPALYNQNDLMQLRINDGIEKLLPGLTGWAQINGRDELSLEEKVVFFGDAIRWIKVRDRG